MFLATKRRFFGTIQKLFFYLYEIKKYILLSAGSAGSMLLIEEGFIQKARQAVVVALGGKWPPTKMCVADNLTGGPGYSNIWFDCKMCSPDNCPSCSSVEASWTSTLKDTLDRICQKHLIFFIDIFTILKAHGSNPPQKTQRQGTPHPYTVI